MKSLRSIAGAALAVVLASCFAAPLCAEAPAPQRKLGRVVPSRIIDDQKAGFRHLQFASGKSHVVPLMAHHFDVRRRATPLPASIDYSPKAAAALKQMYLNDQLGDCVIACGAHLAGVETGNESGVIALATNAEIRADYVQFCGAGDQGCSIADVLTSTQSVGQMLAGNRHKISGFVSVDVTNQDLARACVVDFGGLTLGINLPNSWFQNSGSGFIWDLPPPGDGVAGGHCVAVIGYNPNGVEVSTWGEVGTITWQAFSTPRIVEECYVRLATDWTSINDDSPSGLSTATLSADLQLAQSGQIPPIAPAPGPTPVPPGPSPTPVPPAPPTPPPDPTPHILGVGTYQVGKGLQLHIRGSLLIVAEPHRPHR